MAEPIKRYVLGKKRLQDAYRKGFVVEEDGTLLLTQTDVFHTLYFKHLDSAELDFKWGRLKLNAKLEEEVIFGIYAFASNELLHFTAQGEIQIDQLLSNETISDQEKKQFFLQKKASKYVNQADILLYEQQGRYLWIFLEVIGKSQGRIQDITMTTPGDIFMQNFPEVYREHGSFLHRYLSIFSSISLDFQKQIQERERYLDLNTAPKDLLLVFASWLGLEIDVDFLTEKQMRRLLKGAYLLNKKKGTKRAIELLIKILLDEEAILLERSFLEEYIEPKDRRIYNRLYGESLHDFTILIAHKPDEKLHAQLLFLIDQFKPMHSHVNIVFLSDCMRMDAYCYLDMNAKLHQTVKGVLDQEQILNESVILQ